MDLQSAHYARSRLLMSFTLLNYPRATVRICPSWAEANLPRSRSESLQKHESSKVTSGTSFLVMPSSTDWIPAGPSIWTCNPVKECCKDSWLFCLMVMCKTRMEHGILNAEYWRWFNKMSKCGSLNSHRLLGMPALERQFGRRNWYQWYICPV